MSPTNLFDPRRRIVPYRQLVPKEWDPRPCGQIHPLLEMTTRSLEWELQRPRWWRSLWRWVSR